MRKHLSLALENPGDLSHKQIDRRFSEPHGRISNFLHNLGDDLNLMPHQGSNVQEDLAGEAVAELEQGALESDNLGAVLESLGIYALEMERLVATKSCTPLTNSLVMMGAQQQLNRLGMSLEGIALESAGDANAQGQLVLESLQGAWNRVKQGFMVSLYDNYESWDDLDVLEMSLGKNHGRLNAVESEFKGKKFTEVKHTGSMVAIWKFFSDRKGRRTDVAAAAAEDVKLTEYVFGKYYPAMLEQLSSLATILSSAQIDTAEQAAAVAAKVEKLKHPLELFDKKFASKESGWLNGVALEIKQGSERNVLTVAGKQFPRLAKLATPGYVNESSSVGQTMREIFVGSGPVGGAVHTVTSEGTEYTTKDIAALIKAGHAYSEALKGAVKMGNEDHAVIKKLGDAVKRLKDTDKSSESALVFNQIRQYVDNLKKSMWAVGWRERVRALQAMRFCAYAAERMIVNAK